MKEMTRCILSCQFKWHSIFSHIYRRERVLIVIQESGVKRISFQLFCNPLLSNKTGKSKSGLNLC